MNDLGAAPHLHGPQSAGGVDLQAPDSLLTQELADADSEMEQTKKDIAAVKSRIEKAENKLLDAANDATMREQIRTDLEHLTDLEQLLTRLFHTRLKTREICTYPVTFVS